MICEKEFDIEFTWKSSQRLVSSTCGVSGRISFAAHAEEREEVAAKSVGLDPRVAIKLFGCRPS